MTKHFKETSNKLIKLAEEVIPGVDIFGCGAAANPQEGDCVSIRVTSLDTPDEMEFIQKIIKYADLFENRTYEISQTRHNNRDYNLVADVDVYTPIY